MLEAPTSVVPSDQNNNMDWSVSDLAGIFWRKKWILVGCVGVSVLLGLLYLHYAKPVYAVRARLLVEHQGSPLDTSSKAGRDKEFLATQAEIISSPVVIESVLPVFKQSLATDSEIDPLLAVLGSLEVAPVSGTNVLSVSYRCENPTEGIKVVDGILDSYQQFRQKINDGSRSESLRQLTLSEEKLRGDLEIREKTFLELREQSPLLGHQGEETVYQETVLEQLAKALMDAREHRSNLDIRKELLSKSSSELISARDAAHEPIALTGADLVDAEEAASKRSSPFDPFVRQVEFLSTVMSLDNTDISESELVADLELAASPQFALVSRELLAAEIREKDLSRHSGPNHPDVSAAREQVVALSERLRALRDRASLALQRELTVAEERERELSDLYQLELEKAKASDRYLAKEKLELDGIERVKTIHKSIVAQLNDWRLVEPSEDGGMGVSVVVLESPSIGEGPMWPKKSLLLSLCVATGLLGGIGIVVLTKA